MVKPPPNKVPRDKIPTLWSTMKQEVLKQASDKEDKKDIEALYKKFSSGLSKQLKAAHEATDPKKLIAAANKALSVIPKYRTKIEDSKLGPKEMMALDATLDIIEAHLSSEITAAKAKTKTKTKT